MKDFIFVPGYAINPASISHIKYNKDGTCVVTIGKDSLTFEGDIAKVFFEMAPKPKPVPVPPAPAPAPGPVVVPAKVE